MSPLPWNVFPFRRPSTSTSAGGSFDLWLLALAEQRRQRWRREVRKRVIAIAGVLTVLLLLAALVAPHGGMCFPPCRSQQSEAKTKLKMLYVAEEAYRAEHDTYTTDLVALGVAEAGRRYGVFVASADRDHFVAVAVGLPHQEYVAGDTWTIGEENNLTHVANSCGGL